jgi:hypothetical protein
MQTRRISDHFFLFTFRASGIRPSEAQAFQNCISGGSPAAAFFPAFGGVRVIAGLAATARSCRSSVASHHHA